MNYYGENAIDVLHPSWLSRVPLREAWDSNLASQARVLPDHKQELRLYILSYKRGRCVLQAEPSHLRPLVYSRGLAAPPGAGPWENVRSRPRCRPCITLVLGEMGGQGTAPQDGHL